VPAMPQDVGLQPASGHSPLILCTRSPDTPPTRGRGYGVGEQGHIMGVLHAPPKHMGVLHAPQKHMARRPHTRHPPSRIGRIPQCSRHPPFSHLPPPPPPPRPAPPPGGEGGARRSPMSVLAMLACAERCGGPAPSSPGHAAAIFIRKVRSVTRLFLGAAPCHQTKRSTALWSGASADCPCRTRRVHVSRTWQTSRVCTSPVSCAPCRS
jgi:hypothetical protein